MTRRKKRRKKILSKSGRKKRKKKKKKPRRRIFQSRLEGKIHPIKKFSFRVERKIKKKDE